MARLATSPCPHRARTNRYRSPYRLRRRQGIGRRLLEQCVQACRKPSIVQHLRFELSEKKFYPLSKETICADMSITNLVDVYDALIETGGEEIELDNATVLAARRPIDRMIELAK